MIGAMSYRTARTDDTSRKVIDLAVGILVGLRGCTPDAAFAELVRVMHLTGMGIGSVATGLVALASGSSSADHADAFSIWGDLVVRRRAILSTAS